MQTFKKHIVKEPDIRSILKPRNPSADKSDFGHALFFGGSYGKMGAAVLAARACMQTGTGLLTVFIPSSGNTILQISVPEAMTVTDVEEKYISHIPDDLSRYTAAGAGPGIGQHMATAGALNSLLKTAGKPLVLDADALNILSARPEWLSLLPENSILTPHSKEFERLSGVPCNDRPKQIEAAKSFAREYSVFLVLKGAGTVTACPDGELFVNSTGNPYMATAGSGDVLCGMILSLLAQGYSPRDSAIAGVFLHGQAGDRAVSIRRPITAGDIVDNIAF